MSYGNLSKNILLILILNQVKGQRGVEKFESGLLPSSILGGGPTERPLSGRSPLETKYLSRTARRTATQSTRERPLNKPANGQSFFWRTATP